MGTDLLKQVESHYDEYLVKMCKDLIDIASAGLRELKENYGDNLPTELLPHKDLYTSTISTCSEFLQRTGNWFSE